MTKRKKDSTIIISDSDEESEALKPKTKKKATQSILNDSPLPKKRISKKIIELFDAEDESEEEKPKVKKRVTRKKTDSTEESEAKPKVTKTKATKTTTRKRKSDTADEMGGCISKKRKTAAPKSTVKSEATESKQSIEAAQALPPVASPKRSVSPNAEVKPQTSGFKEYTITPSVRSPKHRGSCIHEWTEVDYVHEHHKVSKSVAANIIRLFQNDNTVPFIARYRRAVTGGLDADQLRLIKESYDRAQLIKHKADNVIKAIEKVGKWSPELHNNIKSIKSLNELEHVHSLYKTTKKTLAEKARELGLAAPAEAILQGKPIPDLNSYVNKATDGLKNKTQIKEHIIHILADTIVKNKQVFDKINELRETMYLQIETKKSNASKASNKNENKENKYDMYYEWGSSEKSIKPHQILAINRAESQKVITVKLKVPEFFVASLRSYVRELYPEATSSDFHRSFLKQAFEHAYKKSIKPSLVRRARSEMKEKAEEASMEVFATNVKQLLLTPPVRGKVILGIDPGFTHGCKLAVVSPQGDVLETATIYPHKSGKGAEEAGLVLRSLVRKHQCSVFALGNATACRETEVFLSGLIKSGSFSPLDVTYTIVDESGASIYSCNDEAKAEFPHLDYNVISAISIARRLQDPLAELVKIEPKHLGVGMYQHDLPEKQLMSKLNEVVMEATSFVGVDVNTASQCLLRRVAGLSETKAANIIEWRRLNGPFVNRNQLMEVKGIGAKSFEQCAGFIRIQPETAVSKLLSNSKKSGFNYLDQTWIHPESYSVAKLLIKDCGLDVKDIGSREFISAVKVYATQGYEILAKKLKTDVTTLEIIIKGLTMKRDEDIRAQNSAPLFRNSLRSVDDLEVGSLLSGEVRNVTHFGAFVDMGVGKDGLIHVSQSKGETLKIGQRVDVKVQSIVKERGRIGLILIKSY